jgi:uncharacterized protein involved in cysteine biosynthesis
MIIEDTNSIKKEIKDLRRFGIAIGIVLTLLGALYLWRGKDYFPYFFIFSAAFFIVGIFIPNLLKPIHKILAALAIYINWIITRIILIALFYLVFTPIGLLIRLSGKDNLNLKFRSGAKSYWIPRKTTKFERDNYERQF